MVDLLAVTREWSLGLWVALWLTCWLLLGNGGLEEKEETTILTVIIIVVMRGIKQQ